MRDAVAAAAPDRLASQFALAPANQGKTSDPACRFPRLLTPKKVRCSAPPAPIAAGVAQRTQLSFSETWTIAKERSKSGVAREIPLSDAAMRIIEGLPRVAGADGFIFSTTGATAVSRFPRAKTAIDQMTLEMMKKQAEARGDDPASVTPARWSFHHLRRTIAWNLERLGVKLEVAEAVLDDASGRRAGIAGFYPRREYVAERRIALAVWANRLAAIVTCPATPAIDSGKARLQ